MTFLRHLAWQWHWILLHLAICTLPWLLHGDDAGLEDTRRLRPTPIRAGVVTPSPAPALAGGFGGGPHGRGGAPHGRALKALRQAAEVET